MVWDDNKTAGDDIFSSEWNSMVADQKGRIIGTSIDEAIADSAANRPAAGTSGRIFFETDTGRTLYDNGTSWVEIGLSESEISLANLGSNLHSDLTGINSDDHHVKYTDEDAQDAVGTILSTDFTYDDAGNVINMGPHVSTTDAHHVRPVAGTHLTEDASSNFNVDESTIDATNLDGSSATAGQFLQSDGTNLSFSDVSTGTIRSIRSLQNRQVAGLARLQFEHNLTELGYDGGLYAIWRDQSKIASQNQVNVQTLSNGDANGIIELGTVIVNTWMLSSANYSGTSLATQDTEPRSLFWKGDGTKFWEIGSSSDLIYEYSVSTAWDLSTATYSGTSLSTQDGGPSGIFWKSDGTKFWEIGFGSALIYEWDVGTAWDLSTATYSGTSISTQDTTPTSMFWKSDGTKFWEIGSSSALIYEYNVSTAWDLSTASYSGTSLSTQDGSPTGLFWKSDGTKFWEIGELFDEIYEWDVGTAWDISTATYSNTSLAAQDTAPQGLFWKPDGSKFWEIGYSGLIYEYNVGGQGLFSSGSITLVSKDLSLPENGGFTNPPTSVVLSQSATIDTGEDIQYTVRDGNNKTVTITQSDVDTEIDTSNFTSTTVEVDVELSQTSGTTPTSDDVMVHFQQ